MWFLSPWMWAAVGAILPLSGTVVDAQGRPVEAAEVWLARDPGSGRRPVLVRGRTDAGGRFTLDRPDEAGAGGEGPDRAWWLGAYRPGGRAAWRRSPAPDAPVSLVLGAPGGAVVHVLGPDGEPVAGARIRPEQVRSSFWIPRDLAEQLGATTDAAGRAVLDSFDDEDVTLVTVEQEGFGTQRGSFLTPKSGPKTFRLRPAASLVGRIIAEDPDAVRGWKITVFTRPDEPDYRGPEVGVGEAHTDDRGRFAIPAVAAGRLRLGFEPPGDLPYRPATVGGQAVREGEPNEVSVTLAKAVRVEGSFRERGTGVPVAGAGLTIFTPPDGSYGSSLVSDSLGLFKFLSAPGKVRVSLSHGLRTHVVPPEDAGLREFDVAGGAERLALPPFELIRAVTLRGVVRDGSGGPVAAASVVGRWEFTEGKGMLVSSSSATSDPRGEFVLEGIGPGAVVRLSARRGDEATPEPITVRAGPAGPVALRLVRSELITLRGRVLGPDGRPVPDALVRIRYMHREGSTGHGGEFVFADGRAIRTRPDGTFETPRELVPEDEYHAEVTAAGLEPGRTVAISPPATSFPDLTLLRTRGLRAIAGRVLDPDGRPVAGATVFQSGDAPRRTEATTDDQGRFRLAGVGDGPAYLFARKVGFRFSCQRIGPDAVSIAIVLASTDGPPPAPLRSLPSPLSRAEERALGRTLIEPDYRRADPGGRSPDRMSVLDALARVDPERVLGMIEDQILNGQDTGRLVREAALGMLEDDPRAAVEVIEAVHVPEPEAQAFLALAAATPDDARERRRDLLDRAARQARAIVDPDRRAVMLAEVADRGLDLGEPDRAAPLAREAEALVKEKRGGFLYPRGEVADALARIDPAAALALLAGEEGDTHSDPRSYDRHRARIAERIAASDPAGAGRLLALVRTDSERREATARVCVRMAASDLEGARRLGSPLGNPILLAMLPAHAARAITGSDPAAARARLDEAFAALDRLAEPGAPRAGIPPAVALACLLPLVERLDPTRVQERLWCALAARTPSDVWAGRVNPASGRAIRNEALLAMLVARYDRAAADVVFEPVADRVPALAAERAGLGRDAELIFLTAAAYDPRAAVALLGRLPDDPPPAPPPAPGSPRTPARVVPRSRADARLATARALGRPIDERRREALRSASLDWLAIEDR